MKWIDVSVPLSSAQPTWPADEPFSYWVTGTLREGSVANCAAVRMSVHFGTHVDAPYHFVDDGKTVDEIDPALLIGPCLVVDVPEAEKLIEPAHLDAKVPPGTRRLLVKTRNGRFLGDRTFHTDFVAFSESGVELLLARGVRLLGFDYFSIAPYECPGPVHVAFLGAGGVVIENVVLRDVAPGDYEICCLPLKIKGSGGAPARVFLGRPE
jgi:arylformamidase